MTAHRWGKFVFPNVRTPLKPMSLGPVNKVLRRLGYTVTGHAFRSMASTCLNEEGWSADACRASVCTRGTD